MGEFDLKALREKLNLTQSELANQLGVGQETISRLEKNPTNMSVELFLKLCQVANMQPNDILTNFKLAKPQALETPDVYKEISFKKRALQYFVNPKKIEYSKDHELHQAVTMIDVLYDVINLYGSKPLVAFLGPSDAGKSTLINSLTGLDTLLSQWTPTTSATVYLKHIEDRPEWLQENVCIFKAESKDKGWNFRKIHDRDYCESLKIISGDYKILDTYCNRNSSSIYKNVDSAVVYLDTPILKACDIVDLPGFGTEELNDTIQSQRAREHADAVVFLCQSNSFFNKHQDVLFLKDVIRNLAATTNPNIPLLSNLFIVASQAHIVEDSLPKVLARGKEALSSQMSDEVINQFFNVSKQVFDDALSKRFFSYSLERSNLRKAFEEDLLKFLVTTLPANRNAKLDHAVVDFKNRTSSLFANEIKQLEQILADREASKKAYQEKLANKGLAINDIRLKQKQLVSDIESAKKHDIERLRQWKTANITESKIISIINEKGYDKKKAQEYLASNVSDLYYAKLQEILRQSTEQTQEKITKFFSEVEEISNDITKVAVGGVDVSFDFKGTVAGGLAGVSVFGALGLWAATAGNLGGYILVAKGVSLLSALGISVGGTAAAASFVSLIGGPITIGIGLALGAFALFKAFFGDGWKERIAKDLIKAFEKENVLQSYESAIEKYWRDTTVALESVVTTVIKKIDDQLDHLKTIIETTDPEVVQNRMAKLVEVERFFKGIPWEGDEQ